MVERYNFKNAPLPLLATKQLEIGNTPIYSYRISEGIDVYEKPLYFLEVRNLFGMLDKICEKYTQAFTEREQLGKTLLAFHKESKEEYTRLQIKQQERIEKA